MAIRLLEKLYYLKNTASLYLSQTRFVNITLLFLILSITILYFLTIKVSKVFNKERINWAKRSSYKIHHLDDILKEVHYASSHCRVDPMLVGKCIALLKIYPPACNNSMPVHAYTPFLRACWNGSSKLIYYMIRAGANIHATTTKGEGAIYLATYGIVKNNEHIFTPLKLLVDAGADINAARNDGYTALYLAAARGNTKLVLWLLAHGARTTLPGLPTARQVALHYGMLPIGSETTGPIENILSPLESYIVPDEHRLYEESRAYSISLLQCGLVIFKLRVLFKGRAHEVKGQFNDFESLPY